MSTDIVYHKNPLSELLVNESSNIKDVRVLNVSQDDPVKLLKNNRVDIALINLLEYGLLQRTGDFRILPHSSLLLFDYTKLLGIRFKDNLNEIKTVGSDFNDPYLFAIGKIVFSERYSINFDDLEINNEDPDILLTLNSNDATNDLSEDWFDTLKLPLPIYVWVCRAESEKFTIEEAKEMINSISNFEEIQRVSEDGIRSGKIIKDWADDVEKAFDDTLEHLFYHGLLPEIYATKAFGVNTEEDEDNQDTAIN